MDKYQLKDYDPFKKGAISTFDLAKQAHLAIEINEERKSLLLTQEVLIKELESMITLNQKMISEFNGRVPPWEQTDEEHLHDLSLMIQNLRDGVETPRDKELEQVKDRLKGYETLAQNGLYYTEEELEVSKQYWEARAVWAYKKTLEGERVYGD